MNDSVISGTGLYTPDESIGNEELVESYNAYCDRYASRYADEIAAGERVAPEKSSADFIFNASGIRQRYVITRDGILDPERMAPVFRKRTEDEPSLTCEIALKAAHEALEQSGLTGPDLDAVIVACANMERAYPAMAIEIQNALGASGFAYDMNVACSSATFGIQNAVDAIAGGSAKRVLIVNPEITSAHLNWRSRDAHFIFGDVCTAVIVEQRDAVNADAGSCFEILGTRLYTEYSNNIRNNFGFLNREPEADFFDDDKLFHQNGRQVFKEVSPAAAEHMRHHLDDLAVELGDVRRFWLHQANINMNRVAMKRLLGGDAGPDVAPVVLDDYANTASAGSIIAFHKYNDDLAAGDLGIICSFGAGYSIGSVIVRKAHSAGAKTS